MLFSKLLTSIVLFARAVSVVTNLFLIAWMSSLLNRLFLFLLSSIFKYSLMIGWFINTPVVSPTPILSKNINVPTAKSLVTSLTMYGLFATSTNAVPYPDSLDEMYCLPSAVLTPDNDTYSLSSIFILL